MLLTLMGTVVIAGIVGYLSERSNFTHNGILQSIIICIGGAFLFYFVRLMFGFGFFVSRCRRLEFHMRFVYASSSQAFMAM